nr:hypothetical protein [Rhodococcus sp. ACS1]
MRTFSRVLTTAASNLSKRPEIARPLIPLGTRGTLHRLLVMRPRVHRLHHPNADPRQMQARTSRRYTSTNSSRTRNAIVHERPASFRHRIPDVQERKPLPIRHHHRRQVPQRLGELVSGPSTTLNARRASSIRNPDNRLCRIFTR